MVGVEKVVVVGAAGFGRECLDVLEAMAAAGARLDVLGVVDDAPSKTNLERLAGRRIAYLGTLNEWLRRGGAGERFVLGIGSPSIRRRIVIQVEGHGRRPFAAIHPSATFGARTTLEDGVVVCAGAVVSNNVRLGRYVHINPNVTIGHDSVLGEFVSVNPGATVSGDAVLGEEVLVGAGAIVLQGLAVGPRTTIGAAALVTKTVPSDVVVKGVPGVWHD